MVPYLPQAEELRVHDSETCSQACLLQRPPCALMWHLSSWSQIL